ncbi:MAG: hypothetical protein FJW96_05720 [Actinobacteria bacterium]|nr:hypothetical protein [Actinomycetota bacterium]
MSTVADVAVRRAKPKPKARARRTPFAGGIVGILVVALLLAGVVAVNVLVLRLNVRYDDLGRERAQLQADVAGLKAKLSSASAKVSIEALARDRLGLVPVATSAYVQLAGRP